MVKTPKGEAERYDKDETEKRVAAALRGARLVGHKPMKPSPAKKAAIKRKAKKT